MNGQQWIRKAALIVADAAGEGLDLSELRFKFKVAASDNESPNTATIRVYNLADDTVKKIIGRTPVEFTRVVLQAGYENAAYGVIFDGTIKQFRRGKENATDSYLDILAAEADIEFNFGVLNSTIAAGSTAQTRVAQAAQQMGLQLGNAPALAAGGTLPRGKVFWGMGRAMLRTEAMNVGATWNIQGGKVNVVPLDGYLPGEAVVLSAATGLIGIPEQTEQGIRARCLLNPKLQIAGLVQIDNASINQTSQADLRASGFPTRNLELGQIAYDKYAGTPQMFADVTADGFYRLYVVEFIGDTRGQEWYAELVGLAADTSTKKVLAK